MDSPQAIAQLARCNTARLAVLADIDQLLLDSQYRAAGYGLTEVRDILLDLRLDVDPR